ncbi:MAG: hypothetical protein MUD08_13140 [Cytophagales bacterium]|jgi:hypothetical protein|nr:hypothetical protein [Cytophagales bacterium]
MKYQFQLSKAVLRRCRVVSGSKEQKTNNGNNKLPVNQRINIKKTCPHTPFFAFCKDTQGRRESANQNAGMVNVACMFFEQNGVLTP